MTLNEKDATMVDVVAEANEAQKLLCYRGDTFVICDITFRNEHGTRHLVIEALELNEYKADMEEAAREYNDSGESIY